MPDLPKLPDHIEVPRDVYETVIQIKRYVDALADRLQPVQLSASGEITADGSASITVVQPETVRVEARVNTPTVVAEKLPSPEKVSKARKWVENAKNYGGKAVRGAEVVNTFLDLYDRLTNLFG